MAGLQLLGRQQPVHDQLSAQVALAVSYDRPFDTRSSMPINYFFADEYPMVRFLERTGMT